MTRAAATLKALSLIVGGLGASHALGDLLGMFSRGIGATGWMIVVTGRSYFAELSFVDQSSYLHIAYKLK
ncbi:hypothetical protein [Sphingomonas sp. Leaf25]|uniref:hypothetical protein n=1 Tax=Sphingomonas sp. Leaf25 TaxID=1735692 RepID=UPI0007022CE8|nr:hypothetical protein [Sphingomonas sp. Leaf25]KQM98749.1 hypothetical protein ASE78_05850 [Sphingomonas sp. Leaf25]